MGVKGISDTGYGVYGIANTTGTAIYGAAYGTGPAGHFWSQNASGPAVVVNNVAGGAAISSTATNGYGGLFSNNSTFQATVYATNAGNGNAGSFNNNSSSRVALAGVNASSDVNAIGVYGNVTSGHAVYGIAINGHGVYGTTTNGDGVAGVATGSVGAGVYGQATTGIGGLFINNSTTRAGLAGFNTSTDTAAVATYGSASAGIGVNGISTSGTGVDGSSTSGDGVIGKSQSLYGVYGASQTGIGTFGELGFPTVESGSVNAKAGVWGDAGDATSYTPIGVVGTADDGGAGFFANNSKGYYTLGAYNASGGSTHNFFRTFVASTPDGACGIGGAGDLTCTGQVKSIVTTASAGRSKPTPCSPRRIGSKTTALARYKAVRPPSILILPLWIWPIRVWSTTFS